MGEWRFPPGRTAGVVASVGPHEVLASYATTTGVVVVTSKATGATFERHADPATPPRGGRTMTRLRLGGPCDPLGGPGHGATIEAIEVRPDGLRAVTYRTDGGTVATHVVLAAAVDDPAAACPRCGGWIGHGGMSQHAGATEPVLGRRGCVCHARALPDGIEGFSAAEVFAAEHASDTRTADQVRRDMTSGMLQALEAGDVIEVGGWRGVVLPCSVGVAVWAVGVLVTRGDRTDLR